jgi:hypothetical protein
MGMRITSARSLTYGRGLVPCLCDAVRRRASEAKRLPSPAPRMFKSPSSRKERDRIGPLMLNLPPWRIDPESSALAIRTPLGRSFIPAIGKSMPRRNRQADRRKTSCRDRRRGVLALSPI